MGLRQVLSYTRRRVVYIASIVDKQADVSQHRRRPRRTNYRSPTPIGINLWVQRGCLEGPRENPPSAGSRTTQAPPHAQRRAAIRDLRDKRRRPQGSLRSAHQKGAAQCAGTGEGGDGYARRTSPRSPPENSRRGGKGLLMKGWRGARAGAAQTGNQGSQPEPRPRGGRDDHDQPRARSAATASQD